MASPDPFQNLRDAIRHSPDNVAIRKYLAEQLLQAGDAEGAEQEYRRVLALAGGDQDLQLGLARAFFNQGKDSEAFVVVEELLKRRDRPAGAALLHARLLVRAGDIQRAVAQYRAAVEEDPDLADPGLADRLGISSDPSRETDELVDGRLRAGRDNPGSSSEMEVERPTIKFDSVGGMETLKEEIRLKIIYPLQHQNLYAAYGKAIGGGVLMYGPPGCGKTHLARATAGEINAGFVSIGINEILDMWIGSSERNLHGAFEQARGATPCVMFFDEVDALGAKRSDMRNSAGRHLINQFLSELDGVKSSNDGLLFLAATNAPWHMDAAFRRPGRFDRVLFVPPPDEPARAEILRILCRGKPTRDIDFQHVAAKAKHFSGADLKGLVDRAVEAKLQEAMRTGQPLPLTTADLLTAVKSQRSTAQEWFATARNHALFANEGGLYDDVLKYLKM